MSYKRWQKRKAPRIHRSMIECERFGDTVSFHKLHDDDWGFWQKEEWDHPIKIRCWKNQRKTKHQYHRIPTIDLYTPFERDECGVVMTDAQLDELFYIANTYDLSVLGLYL